MAKAKTVKAKEAAVTAAHGEVTGKPSFQTLMAKVNQAIQEDPRFDTDSHGQPEGSTGDYEPYVVDILVPDDDGQMCAVIRTDDRRLVRHCFTWDGEQVTLADGESEPTEVTQVYAKAIEFLDEKPVNASNPQGINQYTKLANKAEGATKDAWIASGQTHFRNSTKEESEDARDAHMAAAAAHIKAGRAGDQGNAEYHKHEAQTHFNKAAVHDNDVNNWDKPGYFRPGAGKANKATDATPDDAVTASNPEGINQYTKGGYGDVANKADIASDKAHTASESANSKESHTSARNAHMDAAQIHRDAASLDAKGFRRNYHLNRASDHVASAMKHDAQAASIHASESVIHCKDAGVVMAEDSKWELDKPARFQWMPGGVSTITAHYMDRAINLTVECNEDTAKLVQASLDAWRDRYPKQKPFGCIEHREEEAALYPDRFEWADNPEPGVFCSAMPSALGVKNVNGRIHRSWSPSFTTDAEYAKATEKGGVMVFPAGARGSASNPARITGVAFSVGSLTNKPAFKSILPVRAKQADPQPEVKTNADSHKGIRMKVKFIKARENYAAGQVAILEDGEAVKAISAGDARDYDTAVALEARDAELANIKAEQKAQSEAAIKASIQRAKDRGAIAPKDETVMAKHLDRFNKGVPADIVIEMIDTMRGDDTRALEGRVIQAKADSNGFVANELQWVGVDIRDAVTNGYIKARAPMNQLIREGGPEGIVKASKISAETSAIIKAHIYPVIRKGGDLAMSDVIKAADVTDANLGTLQTGLVLMRNLGFLKNKLGWLPYISTDLRNEPATFNQPVFTRYITPPAVVAFDTTNGWVAQTATTTDVSVTMDQHYGVPITFQTQLLGSTVRNLFAEQQGAQFYSLAEKVNQHFLNKVFAATWSSTLKNKYVKALANFDLKATIGIKNAMTIAKIPDVSRFCLLHSFYYDKILEDSNLLNAKAILALINKDESSFNSGDLPPLFGVKYMDSQLSSAAADGTLTTWSDDTNLGTTTQVGFAGNMSSMLFVSRIPQDYTTILPGIPQTAAIEIATEPDSGLSVMFVKYVDHKLAATSARCALMWGAAQGDPRQGIVIKPA